MVAGRVGVVCQRHVGSMAKSLVSCCVPVFFLLILDLEVGSFRGVEAAALCYTCSLKL